MDYQKMLIELLLEKANQKPGNQTMQSESVGKICMIRTYSAGVFYGKLVAKINNEVRLENARRVWYWAGAASLSQLAMEGTKNPEECKFPCSVNSIELTNVIEVIQMTEKAISSLDGVKIWEK